MKRILITLILGVAAVTNAQAGGISLGSTRIIYPQGTRQIEVPVRNTSDKSTFLVQSWVENAAGNKINDFFVTPPIYLSAPKNEHKLRLMYTGGELPTDRESLFYFNGKAIPSVDKESAEGKNILVVAATTRIKLFYRPEGLSPAYDVAVKNMRFKRAGAAVKMINPTPYYVSFNELKIAGKKIDKPVMLPPKSEVVETLGSPVSGGKVIVTVINDFGAISDPLSFDIE
ncbi:fimbria/pilus periplasmic chaperone [Enterobacter ludwigii]